ncbi:hypothetical protein NLK90_27515, partial [Klebsiella pneumoniae]|uniref:glycosyltransferase n=1 Tax=Klebsiella pneumoniae TaxID=573 RepID=UPI0021D1B480
LIPCTDEMRKDQEKNDRALEKNNAAIVITEAEIKNTALMETVESILNDEAKVKGMKQSAKQMERPDAAAKLVEAVLSIMK